MIISFHLSIDFYNVDGDSIKVLIMLDKYLHVKDSTLTNTHFYIYLKISQCIIAVHIVSLLLNVH